MQNFKRFLYSTIIVLLTGYICSYLTQFGIINWYSAVSKPAVTPPDYIFSWVWGFIYALLILSYYIVLQHKSNPHFQEANNLFLSQLVMQIIWCFSFFYAGYIALALLAIFFLDYIVYKMMITFHKIKHNAAYLVLPYFLWICYASIINIAFVFTNGLIVVF